MRSLRTLSAILMLVCFLAVGGLAFAQERFSQVIEDLPLAPSLHERLEQSIVFDKPSGRVIEVTAIAAAGSPSGIYNFYAQSLPPLGWSQEGQNIFSRQGERLKISAEQMDSGVVVIFALSPK